MQSELNSSRGLSPWDLLSQPLCFCNKLSSIPLPAEHLHREPNVLLQWRSKTKRPRPVFFPEWLVVAAVEKMLPFCMVLVLALVF